MTKRYDNGKIEVICGPMFSEKTTELLRRIQRLVFGNQEFVLFKPKFDDRYAEDEVVTHNKNSIKAVAVNNPQEMLDYLDKQECSGVYNIGIDEVQFFNNKEGLNIYKLCQKLKRRGYRVILCGLDMDANGEPFGYMPQLMAIADSVLKQKAICMFPGCSEDAGQSMKIQETKTEKGENVIELGEQDAYEARCYKHWTSID